MKKQYWMTMDAKDLADKLSQHHARYFSAATNPLYQTWCKNSFYYYSNVIDSQQSFSGLNYVGEQGELVQMKVPQARSLIRQLVTLITKTKLAFKSLAETTDRSVVEEMRIADALVEHLVKGQSVDVLTEKMVEGGLVVGTAFMKCCWRTDKGNPFTVDDEGSVVYEGDVEITSPHLADLFYDFSLDSWEDNDWVEVRVKRNRWTLIAQHPHLEEEIIKLPSANQEYNKRAFFGFDDEDQIYVYELFHRPVPGVPKGRMMFYSTRDTVYSDTENIYGCIPVEQFKPEPITGMGFGYPMFSSLLQAQEMFDHELSAVATNHSAFGVHNIAMPRGAGIEMQELYGLNMMSYTPMQSPGGGKPETLNLMQASSDQFKFADMLLANMQQISNINAALRGDVGQSTSGVAIATLTTNALEFLNSYTRSLYNVLEKIMYHGVNSYTRFATNERMVRLVGKNHQTYIKKFKGEMLRPITSIKIQAVNPLMQSLAGRIEIAKETIQSGLISTVKDYVSILDGEPLSTLYETDQSQLDLISAENQRLMDGLPVHAIMIDDHPAHIQKHKALLNDPVIRYDAERFKRIYDHILEHNSQMNEGDPRLMAMANTGRVPEMPPGGMPGQPPQPMMQGPSPGPQEAPALGGGAEDMPAGPISEPQNNPATDLLNRG